MGINCDDVILSVRFGVGIAVEADGGFGAEFDDGLGAEFDDGSGVAADAVPGAFFDSFGDGRWSPRVVGFVRADGWSRWRSV